LDAPSFLEKTLLPTEAREEMDNLEEDQLIGKTVRQLGQALPANCLVLSKLRRWKDSAKEEVLKVAEQVGELQMELSKEDMALLTDKSKEDMELII